MKKPNKKPVRKATEKLVQQYDRFLSIVPKELLKAMATDIQYKRELRHLVRASSKRIEKAIRLAAKPTKAEREQWRAKHGMNLFSPEQLAGVRSKRKPYPKPIGS